MVSGRVATTTRHPPAGGLFLVQRDATGRKDDTTETTAMILLSLVVLSFAVGYLIGGLISVARSGQMKFL